MVTREEAIRFMWCEAPLESIRCAKRAARDDIRFIVSLLDTSREYTYNLEQRIKAQREELDAIVALRNEVGNRTERRRIEHLQLALGVMTERWERERAAKLALVEKLRVAEGKVAPF